MRKSDMRDTARQLRAMADLVDEHELTTGNRGDDVRVAVGLRVAAASFVTAATRDR